jgi:UDP-glucose 4-epimerase
VLDLRDNKWFEDLSITPDTVVHLVANSRVVEPIDDSQTAVDNVQTTKSVLEFVRQTDTTLIFASSREVCGDSGPVCSESDTDIDQCQNPYAASKVAGEALVSSYGDCYEFDVGILRFLNVYGRYDVSDRVIPQVRRPCYIRGTAHYLWK